MMVLSFACVRILGTRGDLCLARPCLCARISFLYRLCRDPRLGTFCVPFRTVACSVAWSRATEFSIAWIAKGENMVAFGKKESLQVL